VPDPVCVEEGEELVAGHHAPAYTGARASSPLMLKKDAG
jgi:hypothetical protein